MLAWLISLFFLVIPSGVAGGVEESQEESLDVAEIIFEHIGDDYQWHIFSSKRLAHGESWEGLKIDPESGKVVEVDSGKRPFDISITKNVLSLMMSGVLLLVVILLTAR